MMSPTISRTRSAAPVGVAAPGGKLVHGGARRAAARPRPTRSARDAGARRLTAARATEEPESFGQKIINAVTVALTNSPVNEGKKALAKAQAGDYDEAAWIAKIQEEAKTTPVLVFSWSGCPFCKKAKEILAEANAGPQARIKILELDEMGQEGKIRRAAGAAIVNRTSMPMIWIAAEFCGGCNDGPGVATLQREGKLGPMLAAAAALKA